MEFSVLASGSDGNSLYVQTKEARILIDAGLSCKETERRLAQNGIDPASLNALVITHEHSDHIRGAGPLVRKFDLPLFTNHRTLGKSLRTLGGTERPVLLQTGQSIMIRDLRIETFTKCHDAGDPFGVVMCCGGIKIGLLTDLGKSTYVVEDRLSQCQALVLEFNYDPCMLEEGPYPLEIKRRIKGPDGHLSNLQAAQLLQKVAHKGLSVVVLAHLSETNNNPEKAHEAAKSALDACDLEETCILIGRQNEPGPLIQV
jgi:phosphoribosyl 1,2-cyclic phosphodiesterase